MVTTPSFTATSLFPGTPYTFVVAAVNSKGTGPYEPHVVTTVIPTGIYISLYGVNINYISVSIFSQMLDF